MLDLIGPQRGPIYQYSGQAHECLILITFIDLRGYIVTTQRNKLKENCKGHLYWHEKHVAPFSTN